MAGAIAVRDAARNAVTAAHDGIASFVDTDSLSVAARVTENKPPRERGGRGVCPETWWCCAAWPRPALSRRSRDGTTRTTNPAPQGAGFVRFSEKKRRSGPAQW